MKKTLLALTVPALLVAGSASAAVSLYDQDGTQVTMSGAAEVQYYRSAKADAYTKSDNPVFNKDPKYTKDAAIRIDDGDLALRIQHQVSADLYALGAIELAIGESKDNQKADASIGDVKNDGLYVGLGGAFGEMTFGRQLAIIDDAGVGVDIELKDTAGVNYEDTDMDQYIKYRFSGEKFWAGAGYNIAQSNKDGKKGEELLEIAAGVPFGDFEARAYYADFKNEQATAEQKAWDLEFVYAAGPIYVGALYGQSDDGSDTDSDVKTWELAGSYTLGKNTFGLGYAQNSGDAKAQDAMNLYANVAHQLTANTRAYIELGYEDVKKVEEKGFGYVVGMEVKF